MLCRKTPLEKVNGKDLTELSGQNEYRKYVKSTEQTFCLPCTFLSSSSKKTPIFKGCY